ncbi:hypothetical protein BD626DRAFT_481369 [Schizophyllum amplum]|uniref:Uncharacterized protein n=1 Tax=Schizophyllum amplum TaxID=97359 RepID=A0A550CU42_9AGAR|nr:hypothetical protein BD626DRAFT_481369 [Auriculariopsis ampla]
MTGEYTVAVNEGGCRYRSHAAGKASDEIRAYHLSKSHVPLTSFNASQTGTFPYEEALPRESPTRC